MAAKKRTYSSEPLGPTIERLMAETGVTYRALAEKTDLSAGYLNHIVHGNRPVPSNDVLGRIAKIQREGMCLRAAGYACALDSAGRQEVRRAIFTDLAANLSDLEGSELILAGGSWGVRGREGQERGRLIELWGELSLTVPGRLISVKFEDPPTESGVFRAAQELKAEKEEVMSRMTKPTQPLTD